MKRALPFFAALTLSACATIAAVLSSPTAAIGEVAAAGSLRIRPLAVIEDSRCPVNVQCVWAGRLVIVAEVAFSGGRESSNLALGETFRKGSESVTLVAAVPDKVAGTAIRPSDYRFTFQSNTQ